MAQKDACVDTTLPPICISVSRTEYKFTDVSNNIQLIERLKNEQLKFIIQRNFYVLVKVIKRKYLDKLYTAIVFCVFWECKDNYAVAINESFSLFCISVLLH